jgi:hypothetical protein
MPVTVESRNNFTRGAVGDVFVGVYDLGSDMDYKHRWGEPALTTTTVIV